MTAEAIDLLKQLIRIPSPSREEQGAADLIESYLRSKSLEVSRHGNNVWTIAPDYSPSKPTLLLDAHLDTVKAVSGWTHDPYGAEETADGTIYGLGANDDGASLVSLMHAFLAVSHEPLPYNLIFSASSEEEVSGRGGLESALPLMPAIAERGLMVIDVTTHGRSGHAARGEGDNAIYKALDDINWIRTHQFSNVSEHLGPVMMTATIISAGTVHNVIPDTCTYTIDVRSNGLYTNEELLTEISSHIQGEAKARSTRLHSTELSMTHPVVQKLIDMGYHPFGSPTLSNRALVRVPSLKMGPGDSARSHTADEYIRTAEIADAIERYTDILHNIVIR